MSRRETDTERGRERERGSLQVRGIKMRNSEKGRGSERGKEREIEREDSVRQPGSQARERERNNYYLRPIGAERLTILLLPGRRVPHRDCSRDEGHIKVTSFFLNEILPSARRAPFPAGGVL